MRKIALIFVFSVLLLMPLNAAAQNDVSIASLEVDLWPEYDRPDMLVIYRVQLAADVSLPANLQFRIPASAGGPNAVAVADPSGSLMNAPFESQTDGDWVVISLTASLPNIQIEYYDPNLLKDGKARGFTYTWPGDYQVNNLSIQLQQPFDADNISLTPGTAQAAGGSDGFFYHTLNLGALEANRQQAVEVTYTKASDILSVENLQIQPSAPINTDTSGRVNTLALLPWFLGGVGFLFVVGGIVWYWRAGQETAPKRGPRRGARSRKTASQVATTTDSAVYCHQCGKRAGETDRFCRSCGSKLRL